MFDRLMRAIRLDAKFYREAAETPALSGEAALVAVVVALLAALGGAVGSSRPLVLLLVELANGLVFGWLLWALISFLVGTVLGGKSGVGEMARVLAYASTPRLLGVLGFIPCIGWLIRLAGWLLSLVAGIIAIRESMEFSTGRAVVTAIIGWLVYVAATITLAVLLGGTLAALARYLPTLNQ
jgi:Yip1 domain